MKHVETTAAWKFITNKTAYIPAVQFNDFWLNSSAQQQF